MIKAVKENNYSIKRQLSSETLGNNYRFAIPDVENEKISKNT